MYYRNIVIDRPSNLISYIPKEEITMKQLIENVVKWGADRGLDKVGHLAQAKYTLKKTAELLDAYADGDQDKMNDAIGDILVTLIVGASNNAMTLHKVKEIIISNDFYSWEDSSDFMDQYIDLVDSCRISMELKGYGYSNYMNVISSLHTMVTYVEGFPSLKDCLQLAYDEIKNRKGKLVNGQFIKE